MQGYNITKQKGTTMFLLLVFIVGLFAAVGLATDSGHWLLNKTRLQNAMDAAALSAAIALHNTIDNNTDIATAKGKETFDLFKQADGSGELAGVSSDDLTFEYSKNLLDPPDPSGKWIPGTTPAAFVRVYTNALAVAPIYIQILSAFKDPINIYSVSTAGPFGQECRVTPFVMCATMAEPYSEVKDPDGDFCLNYPTDSYCQPVDPDCYDDDGECYGYDLGKIYKLQNPCFGNSECTETLDAGNFSLLDLAGLQGGNDIYEVIKAQDGVVATAACSTNVLNTKPGWTWGRVQAGINDRFNSDTNTTEYIHDGSEMGWSGLSSPHALYIDSKSGNDRREMAVFFGDCRGTQNGNSILPKVGNACVFLTEEAKLDTGTKTVYAEFLEECEQSGSLSSMESPLNGPFKIVLYKTQGSQDS